MSDKDKSVIDKYPKPNNPASPDKRMKAISSLLGITKDHNTKPTGKPDITIKVHLCVIHKDFIIGDYGKIPTDNFFSMLPTIKVCGKCKVVVE